MVTLLFLASVLASRNICAEAELTREELDRKYWHQEILAQEHEERFVALWDDMRRQQDKFAVLKKFPFTTFIIPTGKNERQLELDILAGEYSGAEKSYSREEFNASLDRLIEDGYRIQQLEFHQGEFRLAADGPAASVFSFIFHVYNIKTKVNHDFSGQIEVTWLPEKDSAGLFVPDQVKVIKLRSLERDTRIPSFSRYHHINGAYDLGNNPVLFYDFSRTGLADIILPSLNLIVRNKKGKFFEEKLFESRLNGVSGGIVGEFTGDDFADLIVVGLKENPKLFKGKEGGRFEQTPVILELSAQPQDLKGGFNAVTAGDIDADGDLDLFLGSYVVPYNKGKALPYPFFDANDGEPAYLLENDGKGNFKDITVEAGLGPKRHRLSYSASFVDLDEDRDLDLLVVSDFSGIDVYSNDGKGKFTDVTGKAIDQRSSFGMSHTIGDFNLDGRMDIYVIGMGSTTARRLTKMGIKVEEFQKIQEMVMPMAYGNRMYYGTAEPGVFKSAPNNDQVARTGWGWGSTNFDVDNDGDPEIYVANGHISQATAKDYCTFFWRQDIYMKENQKAGDPMDTLMKEGGSWNGFEHNVFFLNKNGEEFTNVSYMFGLAFETDSRVVISEDFNLDGKVDLIFTDNAGNVFFLRNDFDTGNHWIGVTILEEGPLSAVGAKVTVSTDKGEMKHWIINGDSFVSQHSYKKVFGLGRSDKIKFLEVQWPNGKTKRLENPKADRYYVVSPKNGIKGRKAGL
jgi:hypothetical protein